MQATILWVINRKVFLGIQQPIDHVQISKIIINIKRGTLQSLMGMLFNVFSNNNNESVDRLYNTNQSTLMNKAEYVDN